MGVGRFALSVYCGRVYKANEATNGKELNELSHVFTLKWRVPILWHPVLNWAKLRFKRV